jgi:hypothetical protein
LACEELCETLLWADLVGDFSTFRSKGVDSKGKPFYQLIMKNGESVLIYSPKSIRIGKYKCGSTKDAKIYIQKQFIQ